jgi:Polysaccharide pyruvyl transferase.
MKSYNGKCLQMAKSDYILLTGSKNNAGDYLIKYRAKLLLDQYRPDRSYTDLDRWHSLRPHLKQVNESRALILLGGPALQKDMYPSIFPLVEDLNEIKVPIITFGIGWKDSRGLRSDTKDYALSNDTKLLLDKIASHQYKSGVRDQHTLEVLAHLGYKKYLMTGCPALYSLDHVNKSMPKRSSPKKISFSLGVKFYKSDQHLSRIREILKSLRDLSSDTSLTVVFHHGIKESSGLNSTLQIENQKMSRWLDKENIDYLDISGSAEALVEHYSSCDMHIGFRVHAHIFCSSISVPSLLIAEDGRGSALGAIGIGPVLNSFDQVRKSNDFLGKVLNKVRGKFVLNQELGRDVLDKIRYEKECNYISTKISRRNIDEYHSIMQNFIAQLP